MELKHISRRTKKGIMIAAIITGVVILLTLVPFLIVHNYINKMNIVTNSDMDHNKTAMDETMANAKAEEGISSRENEVQQEDETDPGIPDASEDEIRKIEENIHKNLEENSTPIEYDDNIYNVLLIGGDSRKAGGSGRSDAMILVSVNKDEKKIVVTSILRDIYLQIPEYKNNRINAAYAFGGADLLMDTIENNFKIRIDRYISVDFYTFIDMVDAIDGVTLDVTEKEIPVMNNYIKEMNSLYGLDAEQDCLTTPGTLTLNGKQALGYVRNRYVGNNDFERTARQRRVLTLVFDKVKTLNLLELTELLDIILPQITTNLTEGEIFAHLLALPSYIGYDMEQWSIPMAGTYSSMRIRGMSVLGIDFNKNIGELHDKMYPEG
ncbi:MAG: hypothetical protein K0R34_1722 [Herbinix sp.]|jgi:LCP family protein required for cell wall assembly|nr:hypothetical protein [Herbinix sp.]